MSYVGYGCGPACRPGCACGRRPIGTGVGVIGIVLVLFILLVIIITSWGFGV